MEFAENQDVLIATEIAQSMGYHPWEIASDFERASKFKEITEYLKPYEDRSFILQRLTRGMDKESAVDHVYRYVNLRKQHAHAKEQYEALTTELSQYE